LLLDLFTLPSSRKDLWPILFVDALVLFQGNAFGKESYMLKIATHINPWFLTLQTTHYSVKKIHFASCIAWINCQWFQGAIQHTLNACNAI
jgi:hypothetical protein